MTLKYSMKYIDGFVLVVKKGQLPAYKKMATEAGKMWKKHGALDYVEAMGDDLNPIGPDGKKPKTSFTKIVKARAGEKVFFSFITYKNKAHRDVVNKKVMAEMTKKYTEDMPMPFDMARMAYGGFQSIVDL